MICGESQKLPMFPDTGLSKADGNRNYVILILPGLTLTGGLNIDF